ncbi:HNH endonuclease [Shewanella frigidimarina]|uniref:HNH endonuclease n=1 Tax=Shewanella frigidimarina TaxID=56812 RepID=UPI003D79F2B2
MKTTPEEFLALTGYPIFERIKPLIGLLDVKYIRWWSTDVVTTAEIHIVHPTAKHITIGQGSNYSGRTRIAISLKDVAIFEKTYGKLTRKNSKTYVKYDDEGFNMLQLIAGDWDHAISVPDLELILSVDSLLGPSSLSEYERKALVKQRIGHSRFAKAVKERAGNTCQINTNISRNLIASHIKPWTLSKNYEKVDIDNGLCLSPSFDGLFEDGLISFNDDGSIIINDLSESEMSAYGLLGTESIKITTGQSKYLAWHRVNKLKV